LKKLKCNALILGKVKFIHILQKTFHIIF